MALAETAKLVASLELKDHFSPAANKAMASLGKLETRATRVGEQIGKGLNNAAHNLRNVGIVAAAGIAVAVRGGVQSLAELEDATTSVDGAIKQMGLTGQVTSGQIATWANEIEAGIQAAFDDKAIVQATTTLLRFGKVTPRNIRPAMQVITDLATKTGDVDSASSLLAKALADPEKAAGKLARTGVILTKEQQKQIKAFVKAGKVGKAQKVILDSLATSTKGAAAASAGPYRDALNIMTDVTEDAQRALGIGFLPVITKVAGLLSSELAKPSTIDGIKEFGTTLASGLDSLVEIARNLPWKTIGDSLRIAGAGAKTLLDAFTKLPSWVQTAVLTGWGLNKLTGGALGGIVKELAGGLVKGVLGMTAGVVNIKAGVVTGAGGVPGGGRGLTVASILKMAIPIVGGLFVASQWKGMFQDSALTGQTDANTAGALKMIADGRSNAELVTALNGANEGVRLLTNGGWAQPLIDGLYGGQIAATKETARILAEELTRRRNLNPAVPQGHGVDTRPQFNTPQGHGAPPIAKALDDSFDRARVTGTAPAVDSLKGKIADDLAVQTGQIDAAGRSTSSAAQNAGVLAANASRSAGATVASAVYASRPITNVEVNVSATTVQHVVDVQTRYGSTGGDRLQDSQDRRNIR